MDRGNNEKSSEFYDNDHLKVLQWMEIGNMRNKIKYLRDVISTKAFVKRQQMNVYLKKTLKNLAFIKYGYNILLNTSKWP